MLTAREIEKRKPLWEAMSDLWKDTELFEYELVHIAEIMRHSNHSLEKLEKVCFQEVAPVVCGNLLSTAGVWAGFDSEWLFSSILRNLRKQQQNLLYRWWVQSHWGKSVMTKLVHEDWIQLVDLYNCHSEITRKQPTDF